MTSLLVFYPQPSDPLAFGDYYRTTHLPLVAKLPQLLSSEFALDLRGPDGSACDTFALFRADFADPAALGAALQSPEGMAVAADVPNYATGGARLLIGEIEQSATGGAAAVRRYLDGWNAHDVDAILACFAESGRYTDPATGGELSLDALRAYLNDLFAALPDLALDLLAVQGSATEGTAFWRGSGAGGALDFLGADLLRFDEAGRITWTAALYDQQQFASQLAAASAA